MAGDWIPVRIDLSDDPAVIAVAAALGLDEDTVAGKLLRLWSWANKHLTTGNAAGVTEKWIDRFLSAPGFAAALGKSGWLVVGPDGVEFPKFDRWNSKGAKQRVLTANRVKKHKEKGNAKGNDGGVTNALTREEKRRDNPPSEGAAKTPPAVPEKPAATATVARKEPEGLHHEYIRAFTGAWMDRYPNEIYPFNGGKDGAAAKWFLTQTGGNLEKFKAVVARFMDDDDEFILGHDMGKLRSNFAKWLVDPPPMTLKPKGGFQTQDARTLAPVLQVLEKQRERQQQQTRANATGGGSQPAALPASRLADAG